MSDDLGLPENVDRAIKYLRERDSLGAVLSAHDADDALRRAIKVAMLRAEADGLEKGAVDSSAEYQRERWNVLRAQADALEAGK